MSRGASEIASGFSLNESFGDILTGIILFFIIASEFFILYKLHFRGFSRKTEKNAENTASQMKETPSAGRQSGPAGSDNEEEKREDSANV
jgi:simple sugar transport system permease protein